MDRATSTDGALVPLQSHGRPIEPASHGVLDAPRGGLAERIASREEDHRPATVAVMVAIVGYLVMAGLIVGLGLLLTHVLLSSGVGRWDEGVSEWFVRQRTATFNSITAAGSIIGSTEVVIAVAVLAGIVLAIRRWWRELGLIAIALSLEVLVFLTTTLAVDRPRPSVPRLDPSPVTSSYPSGHAAAAIALWVSLAIVISTHVRNAFVRALTWIVAIGVPIFVAFSRLYRGMHHVTDLMGSLLLGLGALLLALLAVRAASAVAEIRRGSGALDEGSEPADVELAS
jgi:membrane-associated phospholipid phosphatase